MDNAIFKTDDTGAFNHHYITVHIRNSQRVEISKIIFSVNGGIIKKEFTDASNFTDENIDLVVNFTSEETALLSAVNVGNLITYDMEHKQRTCKAFMTFNANNGVLSKCHQN